MIDGPRSAVWQQAANRMHAARAVLTHVIGHPAPAKLRDEGTPDVPHPGNLAGEL